MVSFMWHMNADYKHNSRNKIIERIDDNAPETCKSVHEKYLRKRSDLDRKKRLDMGKSKKLRWQNYEED